LLRRRISDPHAKAFDMYGHTTGSTSKLVGMIREVGSFEAKTRLAELLRMAQKGDEIVVMRRGERVAVIMGDRRYQELTGTPTADWRQSAREYLATAQPTSADDFSEIMRLAREGLQ
jgi:prevent-host-death family protein